MSEELAKYDAVSKEVARLAPKFEALDSAARELRSLVVAGEKSPSHAIRQAAAMRLLRDILDADMMAPIVALQNSAVGMRTDKREGYPVEVVREVAIVAMARGMTEAEVIRRACRRYLRGSVVPGATRSSTTRGAVLAMKAETAHHATAVADCIGWDGFRRVLATCLDDVRPIAVDPEALEAEATIRRQEAELARRMEVCHE